MIVYKFGGASVRSADGVRNLANIVSGVDDTLLVVVSAMGKTTNALEAVTEEFIAGRIDGALRAVDLSEQYHRGICLELFDQLGCPEGGYLPLSVMELFASVRETITGGVPDESRYDYWYDRIVSYGELISTRIVAEYLTARGLDASWLDVRRCFVTDSRHRDANIDLAVSTPLLRDAVASGGAKITLTQGFIGSTADGQTTTLGREGSDYSAAVAANILDASGLTIWKDVEGILNADPKFFTGTSLIPQLTYLDAIELAYSGAQIIHPKTIKPLQNKAIPLYVRPFGDSGARGSVIAAEADGRVDTPVLILKKKQVLISVRPNDFSFVLEDKLPRIFEIMRRHNIRMNLIQSSAVNLSLCVDNCRELEPFGRALRAENFRVVCNEGMELLTIRGYDIRTFDKHTSTRGILLTQKTRRIVRIVRAEMGPGECLEV